MSYAKSIRTPNKKAVKLDGIMKRLPLLVFPEGYKLEVKMEEDDDPEMSGGVITFCYYYLYLINPETGDKITDFLKVVKFPFTAEGILQFWLLSILEKRVFTMGAYDTTILFSTSVIDDLFIMEKKGILGIRKYNDYMMENRQRARAAVYSLNFEDILPKVYIYFGYAVVFYAEWHDSYGLCIQENVVFPYGQEEKEIHHQHYLRLIKFESGIIH